MDEILKNNPTEVAKGPKDDFLKEKILEIKEILMKDNPERKIQIEEITILLTKILAYNPEQRI